MRPEEAEELLSQAKAELAVCKSPDWVPKRDKGRKKALRALAERRTANKGRNIEFNDSLHTGDSVAFFCKSCKGVSDIKPELYDGRPKRLCLECEALADCGWLE